MPSSPVKNRFKKNADSTAGSKTGCINKGGGSCCSKKYPVIGKVKGAQHKTVDADGKRANKKRHHQIIPATILR